MSPAIIKTIAVASGGLVLAAGSWGVYSFVLNNEIPWQPLVAETNFSSDYSGTTKVGEVYPHFLVGTYAKENKLWWKKSYKLWKSDSKDTLSDEFKDDTKIKSAFKLSTETGNDNDKSLNKICKNIYEKDLTDVTPSKSDDNKTKLEKNLWRYCSPLREKPKTISDASDSYSSGTFGESSKTKLISVKDSKNNKFWAIRNLQFFGEDKDSEGIGNNLQETDSLFKNLYETKGKPNKGNIKTTCGEAYTLSATSQANDKKVTSEKVLKFCSLEGK